MKHPLSAAAFLLLTVSLAPTSHAAPPSAGQIVIVNTGDRLTPGYRVTVAPNGALEASFGPPGPRKPLHRSERMTAANRRRFFADLASAAPLNMLPSRRTGLRPQIFVRQGGRQTPNLRGAQSQAGRVLYQDVKQILQVLRMPIPNVP